MKFFRKQLIRQLIEEVSKLLESYSQELFRILYSDF